MIDLKSVITNHPECKTDADKLNAILLDLYPTEEKHRKVLVSILQSGELNFETSKIKYVEQQKIIDSLIASGITKLDAENGLNLWLDALGIKIDEKPKTDLQLDPTHVHKYHRKTVKPTCTENGYTRFWCDCGYEYKEDFVPSVDCQFVEVEREEPTCQKKGYVLSKCKFCGKTKKVTLDIKDHDFTLWKIIENPTCEKPGKRVRTCKFCGAEEKESIPVISHSFGAWVFKIRPECEKKGKAVRTCESCGKTETKELPATGHNYGYPYKDKKHPGKELRMCSSCGKVDIKDDAETINNKHEKEKKRKNLTINIFFAFIHILVLGLSIFLDILPFRMEKFDSYFLYFFCRGIWLASGLSFIYGTDLYENAENKRFEDIHFVLDIIVVLAFLIATLIGSFGFGMILATVLGMLAYVTFKKD